MADTQETDMNLLAQELAGDRWRSDLAYAEHSRLVAAVRRRRRWQRSQERARRLVRMAAEAARRSERLATAGSLSLAR